MKEVKVTPEMLDEIRPPAMSEDGKPLQRPLAELFQGHFVVKLGGFTERQNLRLEHNPPADAATDDADGQTRWIAYNQQLYALGKGGVVSLEIKSKVGGQAFTSVDQLEDFEEGVRAMISISAVMMRGLPLGKA